MSCSTYQGCGEHKWQCAEEGAGYATIEDACKNNSCVDCNVGVEAIFGECPASVIPLQDCIRNGIDTIEGVNQAGNSRGLLWWLGVAIGGINALMALVLFFYVVFIAAKNATGWNKLWQGLFAWFLHPLYVFNLIRKTQTMNRLPQMM